MLNSLISGNATYPQVLLLLLSGVALGLLNALAFRFRHRISGSLMLTLTALPPVVCAVIMLVNGNVGAGLAVAGTFALIRFRSAPGSAREILAIFTSTALGLALGMGYIGLACTLCVLTDLCVLLFSVLGICSREKHLRRIRVTIPENLDYNGLFDSLFEKYGMKAELVRIRNTAMGTLFELTYDVKTREKLIPKSFLDEMRTLNCNQSILIGTAPEDDDL